jgi:hypothetical protein
MGNVPSELLWYSPESVRYLRRRCVFLVDKKGAKQAHLAAEVNWDDSTFSHWLRGTRNVNLDEDRYWPLLQLAVREGGIDEETYDKGYSGISDFLGHPAETTFTRVADFVGDYVIYRYKARNELDDPIVQAKATAASRWCKTANGHAEAAKNKPWAYALIPDDQVTGAASLDGLLAKFAR